MNMSRIGTLLACSVLLLFSCTENAGDSNGENSIRKNNEQENYSVYGRWSIGLMAVYTEGGNEIVDNLPPGAIGPIVQVHYVEIGENTEVQHLICVSSIESKSGISEDYNVFLGDERYFSWERGEVDVVTDLSSGKRQPCAIYQLEKNTFSLRFEYENLSFDPLLVFSRIEDEEWDTAVSRAMTKGTQTYADKLKEYEDFYKDVLRYDFPFVLCQYFEW